MIVREESADRTAEDTAVRRPPDLAPLELRGRREKVNGTLADLAAVACYIALSLVVFGPLWINLGRGYMGNGLQDQNMWEWFFAVTAKNLVNLEDPLFTALQNVPDGVNMMANTAMLGLSVPLAPVTLLFGPHVTWAVGLSGGLAATSAAWYWMLSRYVVPSRLAAGIGAGFCGFAPPIISHANAHPNFVALFLIPLIVLRLMKLVHCGRPVRDGVILGLLVAWQILLGEEPLLIAATGILVFGIVYICLKPAVARAAARRFLAGVSLGAAVCLAIVGYPLWFQFFGPQGYRSIEHGPVGNDAAALTAFSSESIAGHPLVAGNLSINPTEENAFFGWPLLSLVVVIAIWLWRSAGVKTLAITTFVMAALSLGVELAVNGEKTGIPGPWVLLSDLPLFETVIESRLALGCVPLIGMLLALASDRVVALAATYNSAADRNDVVDAKADGTNAPGGMPLRLLWFGTLVAILLPVAPTPLEVVDRPVTPNFFADGTWKDYVKPGTSVVSVPLPSPEYARALRWQVDAGLEYPIAEGYFLGPNGPERKGNYGAVRRPTSKLLRDVAETGEVPEITDGDRAVASEDMRFWRAGVVVLPAHPKQGELRETVNLLLGRQGRQVADVWIWEM